LATRYRRQGAIELSWEAAASEAGPASYILLRNGVPITQIAALGALPNTYLDTQLCGQTTCTYEVITVDKLGRRSPKSYSLTASAPIGALLEVGPTKTYRTPCAAIKAAKPDDVIEVDAGGNGTYDADVCGWSTPRLTLRGVNGRAAIDAKGISYGAKAVWVISGSDTLIENMEVSGAKVSDHNGAAIRMEGPNLTLRRVYFHHNEDGLLTMYRLPGFLRIEESEFAFNGLSGDGRTHNLYVNDLDSFTMIHCYSHDVKMGHLVKTRARENWILYNRLTDEHGTASYEVDIPNGGRSYVIGNVIEQSTTAVNRNMIHYEGEGLTPEHVEEFYVMNNTLVNDAPLAGWFVLTHAKVTPTVIQNNAFVGSGTIAQDIPSVQIANYWGNAPGFRDKASFDYHISPTSPLAGAGIIPSVTAGGVSLLPIGEYLHQANGQARNLSGPLDIGAFTTNPIGN
jgi:hypothetical protein